MQENELINLLDSYMNNDGYYIKPKVSGNETSFFVAKGSAKASDVEKSFEDVKDSLGNKQEKETQIFSGVPIVECAVCADIPNLCSLDIKENDK